MKIIFQHLSQRLVTQSSATPPFKEGNSTSLRKVLSPRNKIFTRADSPEESPLSGNFLPKGRRDLYYIKYKLVINFKYISLTHFIRIYYAPNQK